MTKCDGHTDIGTDKSKTIYICPFPLHGEGIKSISHTNILYYCLKYLP